MKIPTKPRPTKKYLALSGREATITAYRVATQDGVFDNEIFQEFLGEWQKKHTAKKKKPLKEQLDLI